jgi:hypothetical protein
MIRKFNFAFWKNPSPNRASHPRKGRTAFQRFFTVCTTSSLTLYFTFAQAYPAQAAVFDTFTSTAKKVFPNDENFANIIGSGVPLLVGIVAVGAVGTGVAQQNRNQDPTAAFLLATTLFVAIVALEIFFKKLYG